MRRVVLACVAALVFAPAVFADNTSSSGLRGTVKQGPTTPVCAQNVPCDGLARGVTLVFARRGHVPVRARTRDDGTYRVRLAPGRYSVRVAGSGGVGGVKPAVVGVPSGRFAHVNFFVDTGIRAPVQP